MKNRENMTTKCSVPWNIFITKLGTKHEKDSTKLLILNNVQRLKYKINRRKMRKKSTYLIIRDNPLDYEIGKGFTREFTRNILFSIQLRWLRRSSASAKLSNTFTNVC